MNSYQPNKNAPKWEKPNRSRRTFAFATKVTPEFDSKIRQIAFEEGIYMSELLDKMLDAYLYYKEQGINVNYGERERERESKPKSSSSAKK